MALLLTDGFDHYGIQLGTGGVYNILDMYRNNWTNIATVPGTASSDTTPFTTGRNGGLAVYATGIGYGLGLGNQIVSRALPSTTAIGTMGFASRLPVGIAPTSHWVQGYDNASNSMWRVAFDETSGTITIYDKNGTLCATSSSASFIAASWSFCEIQWSISATVGYVTVRIAGATVIGATGMNTLPSSGTGVASLIWNTTNLIMDDLYVLDNTTGPGPYPLNNFLGDVSVYTGFPKTSGTYAQWTKCAAYTPSQGTTSSNATASAPSNWALILPVGNQAQIVTGGGSGIYPVTPMYFKATIDCVGNSITLYSTTAVPSINIRAVVYSMDPITYLPVNPVSIGSITTGIAIGANVFPLDNTAVLSKGAQYLVGYMYDANSWTPSISDTYTVGGMNSWPLASSTPPNPPPSTGFTNIGGPAGVTTSKSWQATLTWQAVANYANEHENNNDWDITYNSASTVGAIDTFAVNASLPSTASVLATNVIGSYRRDDSATRAVQNQLITNSTLVNVGSPQNMTNIYQYASGINTFKPVTSSQWTASDINALQIGYKVTT